METPRLLAKVLVTLVVGAVPVPRAAPLLFGGVIFSRRTPSAVERATFNEVQLQAL